MARFTDIFEDVTKLGRKIQTNQYQPAGKHQIIDQGQGQIAGYTDEEDGLFTDVPAIVFGDHTRILKYVDKPCFLGADGVKLLKAQDEKANYKYLFYALSSINIPNTGYNRHFKWLKEAEIPLPEETVQSKIVSVMDQLEMLMNLRKQQLAKLDELVKARFVEMFGEQGANPHGWPKERLSNLLTIERGSSPRPIDLYITDAPNGVNWIKIGDATEGSIYITKTKQKIRPEGAEKSRYVQPGDFVLSNSMSFGKPYILKIDGYIHDGWLVLRDEEHIFDKIYLHTALSSDYAYSRFSAMAEGGVVNNLNKELVGKLEVSIPPRELQNKFAGFVSETDKSRLTIQQGLDKLEVLKKALMQQYFG